MDLLDDEELVLVSLALSLAAECDLPAERQYGRDPYRLLNARFWLQLRVWRRFSRIDHFSGALGVKPGTFRVVVDEVRDVLEHDNSYNQSRSISVEERVAIALYKLHFFQRTDC